MKIRRRTNTEAEVETFPPDCKMLQAAQECEKSMQASGNRFDGRLGTGGGVYHLLCQEAEQEVQSKVFACKTGSKIQEESRMANYETQITHETWLKI